MEQPAPALGFLTPHHPHVVHVFGIFEPNPQMARRALLQPARAFKQTSGITDIQQADGDRPPEHRDQITRAQERVQRVGHRASAATPPAVSAVPATAASLVEGITASRSRCRTAPSITTGRLSSTVTRSPSVIPPPISSSVIVSPSTPGTWHTAMSSS